jgi:hypothetical protein
VCDKHLRPKEIGIWIKGGRKYDAMPTVAIDTYSTAWADWWAYLQPEWRGETYPLEVKPPVDSESDWSQLRKGGPNGIFILLLSFLWWGQTVKSPEDNRTWLEFYVDLDWVMGQLTLDFDEDGLEEEPAAKRFLFSFLFASK